MGLIKQPKLIIEFLILSFLFKNIQKNIIPINMPKGNLVKKAREAEIEAR